MYIYVYRLFAIPWAIQSMEFSRLEYWSGKPFPSPGDLPNPSIEPKSPKLQADSLPAEPQGKVKSTGVGSLSFLQQIFLTQESNQGLLHCRWILYQLSYQGRLYTHTHTDTHTHRHTNPQKKKNLAFPVMVEIYYFFPIPFLKS